jgi:hypothetical protein
MRRLRLSVRQRDAVFPDYVPLSAGPQAAYIDRERVYRRSGNECAHPATRLALAGPRER